EETENEIASRLEKLSLKISDFFSIFLLMIPSKSLLEKSEKVSSSKFHASVSYLDQILLSQNFSKSNTRRISISRSNSSPTREERISSASAPTEHRSYVLNKNLSPEQYILFLIDTPHQQNEAYGFVMLPLDI